VRSNYHKVAECPKNDNEPHSVQKSQRPYFVPSQANSNQTQTMQAPSTTQRGGRPRASGRVFALTQEDIEASNNVISDILAVNSAFAYVLFDPGASHSFISSTFAQKYNFPLVPLEEELCVSTPTGSEIIVDRKCENCPVTIEGKELLADLIIMDIWDGLVVCTLCHPRLSEETCQLSNT